MASVGQNSASWAWTGAVRYMKYRMGSLYNSFYHSQTTTKYAMVFLFPSAMWYARFRAETMLGYHVYITDESIHPNYEKNIIDTKWTNGRKMYVDDKATVNDLKMRIYTTGLKDKTRTTLTGASGGGQLYSNASTANTDCVNDSRSSSSSPLWTPDHYGTADDAHVPPVSVVDGGRGGVITPASEFWNKIKVGCHGRMFNNHDNLAMATRAFCRRDPKLVIWLDEL